MLPPRLRAVVNLPPQRHRCPDRRVCLTIKEMIISIHEGKGPRTNDWWNKTHKNWCLTEESLVPTPSLCSHPKAPACASTLDHIGTKKNNDRLNATRAFCAALGSKKSQMPCKKAGRCVAKTSSASKKLLHCTRPPSPSRQRCWGSSQRNTLYVQTPSLPTHQHAPSPLSSRRHQTGKAIWERKNGGDRSHYKNAVSKEPELESQKQWPSYPHWWCSQPPAVRKFAKRSIEHTVSVEQRQIRFERPVAMTVCL